jgi:hypothetical protein
MSIITSNQQKRQISIDPIVILFCSVLLVLLVFAISANGNYLVERVLQIHNAAPAGVSLNSQVSFAADQLYWSEYCESGWSADATCDAIVARAQSCSISAESAYCSAYENYLQEFNH